MNAKEFFDLVVRMREAQKNYFKTRSQGFLNESKKLESEVDNEINRVNKVYYHPSLFEKIEQVNKLKNDGNK